MVVNPETANKRRLHADALLTFVWAALAIGWLYLAWIPVRTESQAWLAYGALTAMLLLKRPGQRYAWLRLLFLALAALLTARYFVWRVTETLTYEGLASFIAALALFAAELYGGVIYGLGLFVNLLPLDRASPPLPADKTLWPSVDVFVPSYNEDPEILETTLIAAANMRYAPGKLKVYLLDDGGTEQKRNDPDSIKAAAAQQRHETLQALCNRIGVHYLTRAHNVNAKAGNINAALPHTRGDLIVIFDADHVPTVDFLERTVGAFIADPKLFLVQTPHFFINPDPVEHNLRIFGQIPSENEMFYAVIQRGLDFWEASFFCGSAAVLRRAALMEVGGVSGQSITEDAETALSLHARGWKSAYINRPMIAGLQPETYSGFITQRVRWAQGMLQILLLKNPLIQKGLHWWQRLAYFNSAFFWFFAFARVIFVLAPSAFLILGLHIYNANLPQFFAYALPHVLAAVIVSDFLFGRVRWAFVSELYELTQSIYTLSGLIRVLKSPRSPSFIVTPKGEQRSEDFISELARPFYLLYSLTLLSLGFGVWRWFAEPLTRGTTLITMSWELFNLVLLSGVMGVMLERKQRRTAPRMPAHDPALLCCGKNTIAARIDDISATGVKLAIEGDLPAGCASGWTLRVQVRALGREVVIPLTLAWKHNGAAGFAFAAQTLQQQRDAVALAFGDSQRWVEFRQMREEQSKSIAQAFFFLVRKGAWGMAQHIDVLLRETWAQSKVIARHLIAILLVWTWTRSCQLLRWALDRPCPLPAPPSTFTPSTRS
nr:UDP-forming cellulose synthase catalytic subunit [Thermomonas hydrothermalis]